MIVQLGAVAIRLLGLRWRSGSGCGTEQLYLVAIGIEPRLDFVPGIGDVGTNALQLVAQPIELGIAQTRACQFAVDAVQRMLPSARGGFEIEVELAVQALRNLRLVDMRIGRCGLAAWHGVCRRCRLRRRLCWTDGLCACVLESCATSSRQAEHQKHVQRPRDALQQVHTSAPALIGPLGRGHRCRRREDYDELGAAPRRQAELEPKGKKIR